MPRKRKNYVMVDVMLLLQDMEFGWQIVVGTFVGFCVATFGSVGGVGGGGIFVPMLSLIVGFDEKSSTAKHKIRNAHAEIKT